MEETKTPVPTSKVKLSFSFDLRLVIVVLLVIIAGMFAVWKPWHKAPDTNARTVQVTGETTVKAEPDQYVFSPTYRFTNKDKTAAGTAASQKSTDIVNALKKMGLEDKNIKTTIDSYANIYGPNGIVDNGDYIYTLSVTVTVPNKTQAQQVQDYLTTTSPEGMVTPVASFSETKRKQVEGQARDEATKDARAKAEQNAANLGFKLGAVKTVTDGQGFGTPIMYGYATGATAPSMALDKANTSTTIQAGQNDLSYSVTVTYYMK